MPTLVELAHMVDPEVSKASREDGRFIRAGENDRWIASRGERMAAAAGAEGTGLKPAGMGAAIGGAAGAALGAGGLLALRAKRIRAKGWTGDVPAKRDLAVGGAAVGGIGGASTGLLTGDSYARSNNANRAAAKWRKDKGLSARNKWTGLAPKEN